MRMMKKKMLQGKKGLSLHPIIRAPEIFRIMAIYSGVLLDTLMVYNYIKGHPLQRKGATQAPSGVVSFKHKG